MLCPILLDSCAKCCVCIKVLVHEVFYLGWQCIKEVIFDHQPAFLQKATVDQVGWKSVKAVSLHFQLSQLHQLANLVRNGSDAVLPQVQNLQLCALVKLLWQHFHAVPRHGKVLQVLEGGDLGGNDVDGIVANVQDPELLQREESRWQRLQFVVGKVQHLQVLHQADGGRDGDDLVVPQLQAGQTLQVLEANHLLDGANVVGFQVEFLQVG